MKKRCFSLLRIAFALYCLIMLWLLFGQRLDWITAAPYWEQLRGNANLIPFRTLAEFWALLGTAKGGQLQHAIVNLLGNIGVFIPLGFFLPCLWPKLHVFRRHVLFVSCLILLVELLQLFSLLGSCDIDDLFLNLLGSSLGYLLFGIIFRASAKTEEIS